MYGKSYPQLGRTQCLKTPNTDKVEENVAHHHSFGHLPLPCPLFGLLCMTKEPQHPLGLSPFVIHPGHTKSPVALALASRVALGTTSSPALDTLSSRQGTRVTVLCPLAFTTCWPFIVVNLLLTSGVTPAGFAF